MGCIFLSNANTQRGRGAAGKKVEKAAETGKGKNSKPTPRSQRSNNPGRRQSPTNTNSHLPTSTSPINSNNPRTNLNPNISDVAAGGGGGQQPPQASGPPCRPQTLAPACSGCSIQPHLGIERRRKGDGIEFSSHTASVAAWAAWTSSTINFSAGRNSKRMCLARASLSLL